MKGGNTLDYEKTVAILLWNATKSRCLKSLGIPTKPQAVSLAVTGRCNSRCTMCNIWKQSKETPDIKSLELTGDEMVGLLSRPLFSHLVELDLTGGEPHLREDLAETVIRLAGLKESHLPRLKSIVLTSNGLMPDKVISNYDRILEGIRGSGIDLVAVASLDGVGETHDKIRGVPGAYNRAVETIDGLLKLRKKYPGFYAGIKTTVIPGNIDCLDDIYRFAAVRDLFTIISPVFFTESRFKNIDKRESLELGEPDYRKLLKFYSRDEFETNYFYSRTRGFLAAGRWGWSCTAAYNYLFIDYDGTVYPCELLPEPIGNIKERSPEEIWNGGPARFWRKRINKTETCRGCIEPGAVRYSAAAEGLSYLGFLRHLGKKRYRQSLDNEGYSKYLD